MVGCRNIGDSLKITSLNCGEQVYSCYNEIQTYLNSIEKLKLSIAECYFKYPSHNEFDLMTVSEEGELTSGWGMNQSKSFIQKYNLYVT